MVQIFQFRVTDIDHQYLHVFVWDFDRVGADEVIGTVGLGGAGARKHTAPF